MGKANKKQQHQGGGGGGGGANEKALQKALGIKPKLKAVSHEAIHPSIPFHRMEFCLGSGLGGV